MPELKTVKNIVIWLTIENQPVTLDYIRPTINI